LEVQIAVRSPKSKSRFAKHFRTQWLLQVIVLIGFAYILVFCYIPMVGLINSFNNFDPLLGLAGFVTSPWVGLDWFNEFFADPNCWQIIRNTVVLNFLKLIFSFPIPILLALCINEIAHLRWKKIVQTVSYLPYFISWVVVSGILFQFFDPTSGIINQLRAAMGLKAVSILASSSAFWPMAVLSDIWKNAGWGSIIFLAAIAGVDPTLYEAAIVDGAGRIKRIIHITLPAIRGTIVVLLILNLGSLFTGSFDQGYLLGNNANYSTSEILPVYSLRMGLAQGRFSFATAIGLLQSVITLILVFSSNAISRKTAKVGLF
jgi:putative aldouronate transport system permease protein